MMPEELWRTTMDPKRRLLKQISIVDAARADAVFTTLMGENVASRKLFIESHAQNLEQDEIDIWYRTWLARTLVPVEARCKQLGIGDFLHGDAPGLFEVVLIPQLANARRFNYDLSASPHLTRIEAAALALPAFAAAHPDQQLDAS
jgi:glutathione S-transferase